MRPPVPPRPPRGAGRWVGEPRRVARNRAGSVAEARWRSKRPARLAGGQDVDPHAVTGVVERDCAHGAGQRGLRG